MSSGLMTATATDSRLYRVAEVAKLASDPCRIEILLALRGEGMKTGELAATIGTTTLALAGHLRLLKLAGLIETGRLGGGGWATHALTDKGRGLLRAIDALSPPHGVRD
jgi:DNA-binding transcriptional ArsR family regulator